ncbi:MAG: alpha/beta hydrolase fold domain-containing protein [Segniliparus sp.]|uniref:alpha/beta hydrolase fold domain-containing protein n=1 Tax=Segniliparus sp. TaxID=2804064 RepID=UPI003F4109DD
MTIAVPERPRGQHKAQPGGHSAQPNGHPVSILGQGARSSVPGAPGAAALDRFGPPTLPASAVAGATRVAVKPVLSLAAGIAELTWGRSRKLAKLGWPLWMIDQAADMLLPPARGVRRTSLRLRGVPVELETAERRKKGHAGPDILFFHGGGFILGGFGTHRRLGGALAKTIGGDCYLVKYRKLPQVSFSELRADGLAAYQGLLDRGADPSRVIVMGDSAGGYLALATVQAARDAGLPAPAGLVLLSPWLDFDERRLVRDGARDPFIPSQWPVLIARTLVLAGEPDQAHSPIDRQLDDLPPTLIQVGSSEFLYPDSARLADALAKAGVDVRMQVWEGQIHDFQMTADVNPDARAAIKQISAFAHEVAAAT